MNLFPTTPLPGVGPADLGDEAAFLELDAPAPRWAVYRREGADRLVSYFARAGEPVTDTGLFEYERVTLEGTS